MDGLRESGDLSLRVGRRGTEIGGNSQRVGGKPQTGKEKQQQNGATTHKIQLQNEFDERTEMHSGGVRPPIRMKR